MCGICGQISTEFQEPVPRDVVEDMTASLAHRGPDGGGVHVEGHVGLGHRRLAIVDIAGGDQPMSNEDGTVWVTYNGEIYNHDDLRRRLEARGHRFRSVCDTEVIVHAWEEFGEDCVLEFNGMFAFALWDREKRVLFLARDRLGIKPLYYTRAGDAFIFASEIKAVLRNPAVTPAVDVNAVPQYLFCTTLLNGGTMFKGIRSLPPGHTLTVRDGRLHSRPYWDIELVDEEPRPLEHYTSALRSLLEDSVRLRLMSDVPLGSLLSGGLDSSIISALASRHVRLPLKTFSMEYSGNEELNKEDLDPRHAETMAGFLGTDHRSFLFDPDAYTHVQEEVIRHAEKPVELTTPSLYLLYERLKPHVTVVLSGEGADELLGGYYFFLAEAESKRLTEFPWAPYSDAVASLMNEDVERRTGFRETIAGSLRNLTERHDTGDFMNRVLYLFLKLYLLEMLERQDKMSMAWGMEARVPFLDHRVIEMVAGIPSEHKTGHGTEKYLLRESFRGILPDEIVDRKKKPFPFPIDPRSIVRQRNKANELVQSGKSRISEYFDKERTSDFFAKRNRFRGIDSLALFRTSHAMIVLERWHKVFGV